MQLNTRAVRRYLAASLITLALPAYAAAQASPAAVAPATRALATIRIDNFGQVDSHYYRGAQPKGSDYADLAALGVRTVIDLTKDGDPAEAGMAQQAGMKFVRIPMTTREAPSAETVARFLQIVNDPANQPVFVHCQGGRHRTGVMTAVYRMTDEQWNADQAFAEMKRYKFGADFLHPEFKQFVYGFKPTIVRADATSTQPVSHAATKASGAHTVDAKQAGRQ